MEGARVAPQPGRPSGEAASPPSLAADRASVGFIDFFTCAGGWVNVGEQAVGLSFNEINLQFGQVH